MVMGNRPAGRKPLIRSGALWWLRSRGAVSEASVIPETDGVDGIWIVAAPSNGPWTEALAEPPKRRSGP